MHRRLATLSAVWLLVCGSAAAAVDLTECRQLIRAGEIGELKTDLDCGASPTWPFSAQGVFLDHGGTVNLNGHSIRGNGAGVGVGCFAQADPPTEAPCTVNGPGEIAGFEIGANGAGCTLVARDLTVQRQGGVLGGRGRALLVDSVAARNARDGKRLDIAWVGPLRLVSTSCGRAAKIRWERKRTQGHRKVIVRRVRCG